MDKNAVTQEQYDAAIEAIHHVVNTTDPATWVPKIVKRGRDACGNPDAVYDVDGESCYASWGGLLMYDSVSKTTAQIPRTDPVSRFNEAQSGALLRLVTMKGECTLFASPIGDAVRRDGAWIAPLVDVVVGFLSPGVAPDASTTLTPAWDAERVYPMIGLQTEQTHAFSVPPDTCVVVCATLNTEHRRAVALSQEGRLATKALGVVRLAHVPDLAGATPCSADGVAFCRPA